MEDFTWKKLEGGDYVYSFSGRPECLALIAKPPQCALDIGCGSGGVGHALRARFPAAELWGCELDASAASQARQHFDHVVEQDVEQVDFESLGMRRGFDLICLFDVLEHLVNPWKLLQGLHRLADPDAHVIVSMPNAGNLALLSDALNGHWHYRSYGLLDITHLRFFTDYDARKMFFQTGYRVISHRVNMLGWDWQTFTRCRDAAFPLQLELDNLSIRVTSIEHLTRLCASQNIYLLERHHGALRGDDEMQMASSAYPPTRTFGG